MQDRILKHLFTLFFAVALLLAMEGILISRGEKNVQGKKQTQEIQRPEHQLKEGGKRLQGEQPYSPRPGNKK